MTKNSLFRKFHCGLSVEKAAELCFESVEEVTKWDKGKTIPPICKRLMRLYAGRELDPISEDWNGWTMTHDQLITPAGWGLTPDRIMTGNALIEIGVDHDRKAMTIMVKTARELRKFNQ